MSRCCCNCGSDLVPGVGGRCPACGGVYSLEPPREPRGVDIACQVYRGLFYGFLVCIAGMIGVGSRTTNSVAPEYVMSEVMLHLALVLWMSLLVLGLGLVAPAWYYRRWSVVAIFVGSVAIAVLAVKV